MRPGCALLAAVALGGCYSPSPAEGLACTDAGLCPEGQMCVDGICRTTGVDHDSGCAAADRVAALDGRLEASDPEMDDRLGSAIATAGEWVAIGVENDDDVADHAGAVY